MVQYTTQTFATFYRRDRPIPTKNIAGVQSKFMMFLVFKWKIFVSEPKRTELDGYESR